MDKILKDRMLSVTYAELVTLRDEEELIAGMQYRITDYVTTTAQKNTSSAGHQFDVIVTADNENTLNEVARACLHWGDTYFSKAGAKLEAWQIWYSLDNNSDRFAWADTENGKGVIYRMIDEHNNDLPYDFKNILFTRYELKAPEAYIAEEQYDKWKEKFSENIRAMFGHYVHPYSWAGITEEGRCWLQEAGLFSDTTGYSENYYTFSNLKSLRVADASLGRDCYCNKMEQFNNGEQYSLPNNVIFGKNCNNNSFGKNCNNNSIGDLCYNNSFGDDCSDNVFGDNCSNNTFGDYCSSNSFGKICHSNFFGISCSFNSFGDQCSDNVFGYDFEYNVLSNHCIGNSFGIDCWKNAFGVCCENNIFGNSCRKNSFDNRCSDNSFGNSCSDNNFGYECQSNAFGNDCRENCFGDCCKSNSFGNSCGHNSFGNDCNGNSFGNCCVTNSFGVDCNFNGFGNNCGFNSFKSFYRHITFGDGVDCLTLQNETAGDDENQVQNYRVANGTHGWPWRTLVVSVARNRECETFIGMDSKGKLRVFCLADVAGFGTK